MQRLFEAIHRACPFAVPSETNNNATATITMMNEATSAAHNMDSLTSCAEISCSTLSLSQRPSITTTTVTEPGESSAQTGVTVRTTQAQPCPNVSVLGLEAAVLRSMGGNSCRTLPDGALQKLSVDTSKKLESSTMNPPDVYLTPTPPLAAQNNDTRYDVSKSGSVNILSLDCRIPRRNKKVEERKASSSSAMSTFGASSQSLVIQNACIHAKDSFLRKRQQSVDVRLKDAHGPQKEAGTREFRGMLGKSSMDDKNRAASLRSCRGSFEEQESRTSRKDRTSRKRTFSTFSPVSPRPESVDVRRTRSDNLIDDTSRKPSTCCEPFEERAGKVMQRKLPVLSATSREISKTRARKPPKMFGYDDDFLLSKTEKSKLSTKKSRRMDQGHNSESDEDDFGKRGKGCRSSAGRQGSVKAQRGRKARQNTQNESRSLVKPTSTWNRSQQSDDSEFNGSPSSDDESVVLVKVTTTPKATILDDESDSEYRSSSDEGLAAVEDMKQACESSSDEDYMPKKSLRSACEKDCSELAQTPFTLTDEIDDLSGVATRAAFARLRILGPKPALSFCQKCLKESYDDARQVLKDYVEDGVLEKEILLIEKRNTIVGLWTAYARLLIAVTLTIPSSEADGIDCSSENTRTFDHLGESQASELRCLLLDFTLMVLRQAAYCPLAGNHSWIASMYSKIVRAANEGRSDDWESDGFKHRSLKSATALCRQALGDLGDAETYFDQKLIDRLVDYDVINQSSTEILWNIMGNVSTGDAYMIMDQGSAHLLKREIIILDSLLSGVKYDSMSVEHPSHNFLESLFQLPLPSEDLPICLQIHQRIRHRTFTTDSIACDEASSHRFFDVEMPHNNTTCTRGRQGANVYCPIILPQGKALVVLSEGRICQDLEYFCPFCKYAGFISCAACKEHQSVCGSRPSPSLKHSSLVDPPCIPFGQSKMIGDWTRSSYDPENGPLPEVNDLLDVLDYSVELFEVVEEQVSREATGYSAKLPHIKGQLGLRCRHCDCHKPGLTYPFVFPESIQKLPQAMWYFSLAHLDHCSRQPRFVRQWHERYRRHVRFDSFVSVEYWENVANELGIISIDGGGLKYGHRRKSTRI